jgi:MYXO-CTERM domain-containing protein
LAFAVREPLTAIAAEGRQRETESMKTSMAIGALALAAIAGSANADIVTGPGTGSNCITLEGSTPTTITYFGYTDGSWAGNLRRFSIGVYLASPIGQPAAAYATPVSLIEYSTNAGSSWATYNMGSPNTLLDPGYGFGSLPMGPDVNFGFPGLSPVGVGNFRVRVTLDANPTELINDRRVLTVLSYSTSFGGGQNTRSSLVVPTPGAAALLGLGGLLAARRRR